MAPQPYSWPDADRRELWSRVRGFMARRGLRQVDVAQALHVDRSVLSRRFAGEIRVRPDALTIEQLGSLLELDPAELAELSRLAGYADVAEGGPGGTAGGVAVESMHGTPEAVDGPVGAASRHSESGAMLAPGAPAPSPSGSEAADSGPLTGIAAGAADAGSRGLWLSQPGGSRSVQPSVRSEAGVGRAWGRRAAILGAAIALLAAVVVSSLAAAGSRPIQPGGVWVRPRADETIVGSPIRFGVRAYAAAPDAPAVAYVNVTITWDGRPGSWLVACRLTAPRHTDFYECEVDPVALDIPPGRLRISFDVYDERGTPNRAPHGVRTISYIR